MALRKGQISRTKNKCNQSVICLPSEEDVRQIAKELAHDRKRDAQKQRLAIEEDLAAQACQQQRSYRQRKEDKRNAARKSGRKKINAHVRNLGGIDDALRAAIRVARNNGISWHELERRSGVRARYIQAFMKKERSFMLSVANRLAAVLGLTLVAPSAPGRLVIEHKLANRRKGKRRRAADIPPGLSPQTQIQVPEICRRWDEGESRYAIATALELSFSTVDKVLCLMKKT